MLAQVFYNCIKFRLSDFELLEETGNSTGDPIVQIIVSFWNCSSESVATPNIYGLQTVYIFVPEMSEIGVELL